MSDSLELARERRAQAGHSLVDARIERMLDQIGLSEAAIESLAVSPADRSKLKGIIKRLAGKKDPFTTCMADLAKNRPELSTESRKKICGRLKSMVKGTGRVKALSMADGGCCELIDADVAKLLSAVDDAALAAFIGQDSDKEKT